MERTKKSPNTSINRSTSDSLLKRTSSSVNVAVAKSDLYIKDVKSFGTQDDHHIIPFSENDAIELEHCENCEGATNKIGIEMKTTDLFTNETFIVKSDMLVYGGKRYTFDDIAVKWKKDCRMWLWKNEKKDRRLSGFDELQRNFENIKVLRFARNKKNVVVIPLADKCDIF